MTNKFGSIALRFEHPVRDLSFLDDTLDMKSKWCWKYGDFRRGRNGDLIGGQYDKSYWIASISFSEKEKLAVTFQLVLDIAKRGADKITEIVSDGGQVSIYLQLAGNVNNGDIISSSDMKFMADSGMTLMYEVFPDMG